MIGCSEKCRELPRSHGTANPSSIQPPWSTWSFLPPSSPLMTAEPSSSGTLATPSPSNRSFLFGTEYSLEALYSSPNFIIDGTFKTLPNLVTQPFTVHGLLEDSLRIWASPWECTDSLHQPAGRI